MWYELISDIPIKIKSSIPSAVGLLDASQSPVYSGELLLYLATNHDHLFFYCLYLSFRLRRQLRRKLLDHVALEAIDFSSTLGTLVSNPWLEACFTAGRTAWPSLVFVFFLFLNVHIKYLITVYTIYSYFQKRTCFFFKFICLYFHSSTE